MYSRRQRAKSSGDADGIEANNRRLRQTINYITNRGGADTDEEYMERVNAIKDMIVDQYEAEGYDYDPMLWRRAKRLVEDELTAFELEFDPSDEGVIEISSDTSVDEEIESPEALYRGAAPSPQLPPTPAPAPAPAPVRRKKGKEPKVQNENPEDEIPEAVTIESQWKYGGPHNQVEHWDRRAPPILPFGESFLMQEWESQKINYDLSHSADKLQRNSKNKVVHTNVPFANAARVIRKRQRNKYDSGSKFMLPKLDAVNLEWMEKHPDLFNLEAVLEDFNAKDSDDQIKKDYAPRIFLESVKIYDEYRTERAGRRSSIKIQAKRAKRAGRHEPNASSSPKTSRSRAFSAPDVSSRKQYPARGTRNKKSAAVPDYSDLAEIPRSRKDVTTRRLSHVAIPPAGSRKPGRPARAAPKAPTTPKTKKRKVADRDDPNYDSNETRSSQRSRDRSRSGSRVRFNTSILDDISEDMANDPRYDGGPDDPLNYDEYYTGPATKRAKKAKSKSAQHPRPPLYSTGDSEASFHDPGPDPRNLRPRGEVRANAAARPKMKPGPKPKAKPGPKPKAMLGPIAKLGRKPTAKPAPEARLQEGLRRTFGKEHKSLGRSTTGPPATRRKSTSSVEKRPTRTTKRTTTGSVTTKPVTRRASTINAGKKPTTRRASAGWSRVRKDLGDMAQVLADFPPIGALRDFIPEDPFGTTRGKVRKNLTGLFTDFPPMGPIVSTRKKPTVAKSTPTAPTTRRATRSQGPASAPPAKKPAAKKSSAKKVATGRVTKSKKTTSSPKSSSSTKSTAARSAASDTPPARSTRSHDAAPQPATRKSSKSTSTSTSSKPAAKKPAAKRVATGRVAKTKKAPVKKAAPAKKAPVKKTAPAKKAAPAKKTAPAKIAPAKKVPVKKAPAKKTPAKRAPPKPAATSTAAVVAESASEHRGSLKKAAAGYETVKRSITRSGKGFRGKK